MKDKFNLQRSAELTWAHMKTQLVSFVVQGLFFSKKLSGFMSKVIKLLLTELVGQYRNIIAPSLPSVGQYRKGRGQYIPALTSQSVNKSIVLCFQSRYVKNINNTGCPNSMNIKNSLTLPD